ncbi:mRNA export factor RAE1-like [Sycon ciliatum]|uniref:mRNA export factor RAE1-like n=1 Tax=Sycon ciliatum TaxID=27933 RepID=UPI0031F6E5CD|eukprot:scpid27995/ scgid25314/ mRNA export factor; Rae1 protein homolog; mRNA-associated protein mrnp 41 &gt; mRNA export factor; Rae1 protein homolog; mRNA-associated protein mrnp 41
MYSSSTSSSNPLDDVAVPNNPSDGISHLEFSPKANHLIASSWDGQVRCWDIQQNGEIRLVGQQAHQAPVLDCGWHSDGTKVFTASCDKTAKLWDLASNQATVVAQHEAPIRTCHWVQSPSYQLLMTGSWDKTLKFWDPRSSKAAFSFGLPDRCYCADVVYPFAVVCTAGRGILWYQLGNQPMHFKDIDSVLKYQLRSVAIFRDKSGEPAGMAYGSIEGRIAVNYLRNTRGGDKNDNFQFKCHRGAALGRTKVQEVYAVNDLAFHPVHHSVLASAGSDGIFSYWDKDEHSKLPFPPGDPKPQSQSISAICFNTPGDIMAYAVSYDWAKGHELYNPQFGNHIYLRPSEALPTEPAKKSKGRR